MASCEHSNDLRKQKERNVDVPIFSAGNGEMVCTRPARALSAGEVSTPNRWKCNLAMRSHLPVLILAVLAILLDIGPSFSQIMPGCIPPIAMEIHVGKLVPDAIEKRIEGQGATSFVSALNAVKATSALVGDLVLVFESRQMPGVGVTIFNEGCLVAQETFRPSMFKQLMVQAGIFTEDM